MSFMRNLPIRLKLTVIILLSSMAALCFAGLLFLVNDYRSEQEHLSRDTQILARVIADRSTAALSFEDRDLARDNLLALELSNEIELGCIYKIDSDQAYARYQAKWAAASACPEPVANEYVAIDAGKLHVHLPIAQDGHVLGEIYLRASMADLQKRSLHGALLLLGFGAIGLVLAYLLSRWLQRAITRPLQDLIDTASDIGKTTDFSRRAEKMGDDELGSLVDNFNAMLDVIQKQNAQLLDTKLDLEAQVKARTRELSSAYDELEAFSYSVSHDLRAPLRAISGFSDALLEEYRDSLDAQGQDYLRRVNSGTQRMRDLIDDLLTLSKATRQKMNKAQVDISQLASESCEMLRQLDPGRPVEVHIQPGLVAKGDGRLLKLVMDNLLGNAWKYSRHAEQAAIEFGVREHTHGKAYFVRDNGVGFDMQYKDKLFTPFQRLHDAKEFEGTGIGLATVARIIRRHGGEVWAESEPGRGAVFWFTLAA